MLASKMIWLLRAPPNPLFRQGFTLYSLIRGSALDPIGVRPKLIRHPNLKMLDVPLIVTCSVAYRCSSIDVETCKWKWLFVR